MENDRRGPDTEGNVWMVCDRMSRQNVSNQRKEVTDDTREVVDTHLPPNGDQPIDNTFIHTPLNLKYDSLIGRPPGESAVDNWKDSPVMGCHSQRHINR